MASAKGMKCCSKRSVKLKQVSFAKAKAAAEKAQHEHVWDAAKGTHTKPRKAASRKAPARKAKPCKVCGKAKK